MLGHSCAAVRGFSICLISRPRDCLAQSDIPEPVDDVFFVHLLEVARKRLEKWFIAVRWANGFLCPYCGHRHGWRTQRDHWVCVRCRSHVSATAGTLLHGVRDLERFLLVAWWYCGHQGARTEHVRLACAPMSYKTAWQWCRKIRSLMSKSERHPLDGHIEAAMVDEQYPVILLAKRGRGGRIEAVRAMVMDPAAISSLHTQVAPGSYVIIPAEIVSYIVAPGGPDIPYRFRVYDKGSSTATRQVCDRLRHFLRNCSGSVAPAGFALYLNEFSFRYNHRNDSPWRMVRHLICAAFATVSQDIEVEPKG